MAYAENTQVSSEKSRIEIEKILMRYGANDFAYATRKDKAVVQFTADGRQVRFTLPLPPRDAPEFVFTPSKKFKRTPAEQEKAYEQAVRSRWRALCLVIKAKLEAVEAGIVTFEQEFLPHIVLPGTNATVYENVAPAIEQAYVTGKPAQLLAKALGM